MARFLDPPLSTVHGVHLVPCPHLGMLLESVDRRISLPRCVDRLSSAVKAFTSAKPSLEPADVDVDEATSQQLLEQAIAEQKRERDLAVETLIGKSPDCGGCSILQRPGTLRGRRQIVVVIQDVSNVRGAGVACLIIGKSQSVSCFLHPGSKSKHGCVDKSKLRQLFAIESAVGSGRASAGSARERDAAGALAAVSFCYVC